MPILQSSKLGKEARFFHTYQMAVVGELYIGKCKL